MGAIGEIVYLGMFNTFIGIFYNQAIGLSNSLIGTAIMLALIGDAISDPLVGMISDRWRSSQGRRHPFLYVAPLPVAIALYCIFSPPGALTSTDTISTDSGQFYLFLWLTFWTILSRLFLTLYSVPHLALGGELTNEPTQRSQLFSVNAVCGYATGALFAFLAWGYFLGGESLNADGVTIPRHLDPTAYGALVFTACGSVLFAIWLCAWGTRDQIPHLSDPPVDSRSLSINLFYQDIFGAMKNPNYAFLLVGFFFFMISVGLNETFGVFVNTYFWELGTEQMRWFGLAAVPAILLGAVSAPILMRRFDRKPVLICALLAMTIFAQLAIWLRIVGLFPANDSPFLLPLLISFACGLSLALAVTSVAVLSMLGDIADENELATGKRQEGLVYSARAFFAKASGSFGHFLAGIILDLFVRLPFEAVPGQVDADVILRLGLAAGPIMGAGAFISIFFYARYNITSERHSRILAELAERRSAVPVGQVQFAASAAPSSGGVLAAQKPGDAAETKPAP